MACIKNNKKSRDAACVCNQPSAFSCATAQLSMADNDKDAVLRDCVVSGARVTCDLPDESSPARKNILLFRNENQAYVVTVLLPI